MGDDCRLLDIDPLTFGSEPHLISLGNRVTVTAGVRFITHDGAAWVLRKSHPGIGVYGPISVGNNVFIGFNALILPDVHIGDDSIVAAGAVVTRDVPSGAVVGGVPARVLSRITDYEARALAKAELNTAVADRR
ncbi:acyltransferase [Gryllotalpicola reticulitermitis]|uniref:Acyltransferase n=1 Tax=Gryllotalpicola reticulitermitis TaxID=1184153 RepID=A0ABV8Q5S3_9MICO